MSDAEIPWSRPHLDAAGKAMRLQEPELSTVHARYLVVEEALRKKGKKNDALLSLGKYWFKGHSPLDRHAYMAPVAWRNITFFNIRLWEFSQSRWHSSNKPSQPSSITKYFQSRSNYSYNSSNDKNTCKLNIMLDHLKSVERGPL